MSYRFLAGIACALGLFAAPVEAAAADLITNGSFNANINGWTVVDIDSSGNCNWDWYGGPLAGTTGGHAGVLSGAQRCGFYQDVTIPAGTVNTLTVSMGSIDNAANAADQGALQIRNTSNVVLQTLYGHGSQGTSDPVAARGPYNLNAYVGQTVRVFFLTTHVNDAYQMRVDSVVLDSAPPASPVPTLSEWAMILLATLLAGGAAVLVQRRQTPV